MITRVWRRLAQRRRLVSLPTSRLARFQSTGADADDSGLEAALEAKLEAQVTDDPFPSFLLSQQDNKVEKGNSSVPIADLYEPDAFDDPTDELLDTLNSTETPPAIHTNAMPREIDWMNDQELADWKRRKGTKDQMFFPDPALWVPEKRPRASATEDDDALELDELEEAADELYPAHQRAVDRRLLQILNHKHRHDENRRSWFEQTATLEADDNTDVDNYDRILNDKTLNSWDKAFLSEIPWENQTRSQRKMGVNFFEQYSDPEFWKLEKDASDAHLMLDSGPENIMPYIPPEDKQPQLWRTELPKVERKLSDRFMDYDDPDGWTHLSYFQPPTSAKIAASGDTHVTEWLFAGTNRGCGGVAKVMGKAEDNEEISKKVKFAAEHNMFYVPLHSDGCLYHDVEAKHGACSIKIRSVPNGYGIVAPPPVAFILEMFGIENAALIIDGYKRNRFHSLICLLKALMQTRSLEDIQLQTGKRVVELNPHYAEGLHHSAPGYVAEQRTRAEKILKEFQNRQKILREQKAFRNKGPVPRYSVSEWTDPDWRDDEYTLVREQVSKWYGDAKRNRYDRPPFNYPDRLKEDGPYPHKNFDPIFFQRGHDALIRNRTDGSFTIGPEEYVKEDYLDEDHKKKLEHFVRRPSPEIVSRKPKPKTQRGSR